MRHKAEKGILEKSKELEAKDAVAKAAQVKQDEHQVEIDRLKQEHETVKAQLDESETLREEAINQYQGKEYFRPSPSDRK